MYSSVKGDKADSRQASPAHRTRPHSDNIDFHLTLARVQFLLVHFRMMRSEKRKAGIQITRPVP